MVNNLLFRWEDSHALQHHCGFCERPLSHPGARVSCFGTHSEPCHRFHQAMFMRNRAHMCNYCSAIDEAHYKRHHELVILLRAIYECCGEADCSIVPAEPGDPRRGRLAESNAGNTDLAPGDLPVSKRDRKDAKCLVRAANRVRVITQEEIRHVESVLHPAEGFAGGEDASPANLEEMQLIEEHLRYNANVYNTQASHRDLKRFAKIPDVDVDFESEMERVLDTFRISEFVKRNSRNRGLQGKDLKTFEVLIKAFRDAIVEDLVLVKKDMMEIRMRRAGYLRYTNKASYDIIEDRYTDKDWKTGERIASSSDSSGTTVMSEELATPLERISDIPALPVSTAPMTPDRRHLQHIHTRVSGEDGLHQKIIEPYHTPLLLCTPESTLKKPAVLQLRVVENKENRIPAGSTNRGWLRRDTTRKLTSPQPLQTSREKIDTLPSTDMESVMKHDMEPTMEPMYTSVKHSVGDPVRSPSHGLFRMNGKDFPSLGLSVMATKPIWPKSAAPAVQPPTEDKIAIRSNPERVVSPKSTTEIVQPVVSQKKAKKAQREAKRKARKNSSQDKTSSPTATSDTSFETTEQGPGTTLPNDSMATKESLLMREASPEAPDSLPRLLNESNQIVANTETIAGQDIGIEVPIDIPVSIVTRTTYGKHDHWTRFARFFAVDQLTGPLLQTFEGCSHGYSCPFESSGVLDCPFHEPHCACGDPMLNECYLVHPGKATCTSGPHNRAHGERLLAMYEQNSLTKGRLMLVDDDLVDYFVDFSDSPKTADFTNMPPRLLREHTEFLEGYERGPLMQKELEFKRLSAKNTSMRHSLTTNMLQEIQRRNSGPKGSIMLCYCYTDVLPTKQDIKKKFAEGPVFCSFGKCEFGRIFHKHCVNKLGVEKVSRWYCTSCEQKMKALACKVLAVPYKDEGEIFDSAKMQFAEMILEKGFAAASGAKPPGPTKRLQSPLQSSLQSLLQSRSQKTRIGETCGDLEVEGVD